MIAHCPKNAAGQTEHIFKKSNKKYRFNW